MHPFGRSLSGRLLFTLVVGTAAAVAVHGSGKGPGKGKKGKAPAPAQASAPAMDLRPMEQMAALIARLSGQAAPAASDTKASASQQAALKKARVKSFTPAGCPSDGRTLRKVTEYELKPAADLRRAVLRWADLDGLDLSGADLRGADCTGASFGGTILTGARLRRARLFRADIAAAVDLDLTGAELHPFFQTMEDEQVGDFRFFSPAVDGYEEGQPRSLVSGPGSLLLWLQGNDGPVHYTTPTGARVALRGHGNTRTLGIQKDSLDRLWTFGDETFGYLSLPDLADRKAGLGGDYHCQKANFQGVPNAVVAGPAGDILVSLPNEIRHFNATGKLLGQDYGGSVAHHPGSGTAHAVPGATGEILYTVGPERPYLHINQFTEGTKVTQTAKESMMNLPPGCRIPRMARARDGRLFFTQTGEEAIGIFDPGKVKAKGGPVTLFKLERSGDEPRREPFDIAPGPDGNLWFTERTRIGRITPEGVITPYDLPAGLRPKEIIGSQDGRMYFTLEGESLIGCVLAQPRPAPARAESKAATGTAEKADTKAFEAEWAGSILEPQPQRRKAMTDQQRRERYDRGMQRALARYQVYQAALPEQPRADSSADGKADTKATEGAGSAAGKPEKAPAALTTPHARMAVRNVFLCQESLDHILHRHNASSFNRNSIFRPNLCDPSKLVALIADGICGPNGLPSLEGGDEAEADGKARRPRLRPTDFEGRHLFRFPAAKVGYTRSGKATDQFLVVADRYVGEDGEDEYSIVTAYPI
jgi:hypothetical protein